jgi:hypothetical protein
MSGGYEIFEGWVHKFQREIDSFKEVKVPVKDLDTLAKLSVRAKIGRTRDGLSSAAVPLRVVTDMGEKRVEMFIEILQELDDFESGAVES